MITAYMILLILSAPCPHTSGKIEKPIEKSTILAPKKQKPKYIKIPTEWIKIAKKPNY